MTNEQNIYLTLTTRPERLESDHFKKVYHSLNNQEISYTFLIINLSVNDFTYKKYHNI